jgi:parvulin-like peptidyl-prolyl isomerase
MDPANIVMSRKFNLVFLLSFCLATAASPGRGQDVVRDGDVSLDYESLEALLESIPESLVRRAAGDVGERYTLLNELMLNLKLVAVADALEPGDPGYAELKSKLDQVKQQFAFEKEVAAYQVPDLQALALERYETQKDKYAKVPETRASSHLLLYSPPGPDRSELRRQAQELLAQLRAGADFEAMVAEYSGDPASKERGGSIDRWATPSDPSLSPPYVGALFDIEEVGQYSEVTETQFGVHIIRLDGVRESTYKEFDEVKNEIYADLISQFQALATKSVRARFELSDDAFIDGAAMEKLFAPYK